MKLGAQYKHYIAFIWYVFCFDITHDMNKQ